MICLAAVIPGANFRAIRFAGIETCDEILLARTAAPAGLPRDGVVSPGDVSFANAMRITKVSFERQFLWLGMRWG